MIHSLTRCQELADTFGVEIDVAVNDVGEATAESELRAQLQDAHERIDDLETENERLREQSSATGGVESLDSYQAFLEDDDVQAVIDEAKQEDYPSPKYTKGILAAILQEGGPVSYESVADRLGVSRTNEVSSAATTLETYGVIEKDKRGGEVHVDLNTEGLQEIRSRAERRRQTSELMNEL